LLWLRLNQNDAAPALQHSCKTYTVTFTKRTKVNIMAEDVFLLIPVLSVEKPEQHHFSAAGSPTMRLQVEILMRLECLPVLTYYIASQLLKGHCHEKIG
jgi:hypothetical protein